MPGYVVDSSTTSAPGVNAPLSALVADSTNVRSGAPSRRGVGTEMIATSKPLVGDVLHEGTSRAQRLDPATVELVADDGEADLAGAHRDREADIALADDDDAGRPVVEATEEVAVHRGQQ